MWWESPRVGYAADSPTPVGGGRLTGPPANPVDGVKKGGQDHRSGGIGARRAYSESVPIGNPDGADGWETYSCGGCGEEMYRPGRCKPCKESQDRVRDPAIRALHPEPDITVSGFRADFGAENGHRNGR